MTSRRWRAACRYRDRMRPVRDEALSLLRLLDAGISGWRVTGRTTCLGLSRAMLGERQGDIAVRPLVRYLRAEIRTIDRARARLTP